MSLCFARLPFFFFTFCLQQWMTNQGSIEQLFKGNFLPHV